MPRLPKIAQADNPVQPLKTGHLVKTVQVVQTVQIDGCNIEKHIFGDMTVQTFEIAMTAQNALNAHCPDFSGYPDLNQAAHAHTIKTAHSAKITLFVHI